MADALSCPSGCPKRERPSTVRTEGRKDASLKCTIWTRYINKEPEEGEPNSRYIDYREFPGRRAPLRA